MFSFWNICFAVIGGVIVLQVKAHITARTPVYNDCVTFFQKACNPDKAAGHYLLKARNSSGSDSGSPCKREANLTMCPQCGGSGCTGDGWTFVAHFHPNNSHAAYDSERWTSKSPSLQYSSANVTEVCLAVRNRLKLQFHVQAPSMRSLFFEKKLLSNVPLSTWVDSLNVPNATKMHLLTTPTSCYEIGFNVGDSYARHPIFARLGAVTVNGTGCEWAPSFGIGIGLKIGNVGSYGFHGLVQGGMPVNESHVGHLDIYVRSKPWQPRSYME
ncbi:uncharacterized protein LOC124448261 [Xenia sp. Carnegie-2017]|uniref:uncharacterized protein LOC124448261 n=1 Tax=Xenia sp. Carnegie-2017 TaxID=2897299 RepID=UPI001F04B8A7|nr:uncharacterized protein LOC124448261 [Xenia sp. Carnegie-2017]